MAPDSGTSAVGPAIELGNLVKVSGAGGSSHAALGGVVRVVEADAEDLAGPRHRRAERESATSPSRAHPRDGSDRRAARRTGRRPPSGRPALVAREPGPGRTSGRRASRAARPDTLRSRNIGTPCYRSITQYYRLDMENHPRRCRHGRDAPSTITSRRSARRGRRRVRRPRLRWGVDPAHRRTGRRPPTPDQLPLHVEGGALAGHGRRLFE